MPKFKNLADQVFGRLTAKARVTSDTGRVAWYCLCACGNSTVTDPSSLQRGLTTSCGCIRKTHGGSKTHPDYRVWTGMRDRCSNPRAEGYKNYGGRGIKVCSRWDDFAMFTADMGPRPPGASIERADNDGNYEPGNCRWATKTEQANNTSRTRFITINGVTKPDTAWSKSLGGCSCLVRTRLKLGWTEEAACTTPKMRQLNVTK